MENMKSPSHRSSPRKRQIGGSTSKSPTKRQAEPLVSSSSDGEEINKDLLSLARNVSADLDRGSSSDSDMSEVLIVPKTANTSIAKKSPVKQALRYKPPSSLEECDIDVTSLPGHIDMNKHELWLLKTPADMKLDDLKDVKVITNGSCTVHCENQNSSLWNGLEVSARKKESDMVLILPEEASGGPAKVCGFTGEITISRTLNLPAYIIPPVGTKQAPSIPAGLKERNTPFGADQPVVSSNLKGMKRKDATDSASKKHSKEKKKKKKKHKSQD